ncbi:hypothetical protein [Aliiglaciecola sp. M165]|uniref:hypothetical protein n=1 Tax=Aliiglaciecola sp. M165 TaxID=2593649 RepID=UPI00117E6CDB|nr:hypothetical protein [Aliiglaciecola sp. M165]TRY33421.1 hypothetical protein FM019_05450 [Aliiglaciecola sp. M165]
MMRILATLLFVFSSAAMAGGWTNTVPVEHVEIIRGQGFEIKGAFGNPSNCSGSDSIFVSTNHPQYDQLLSVALTAFTADKKLKIYSHKCIDYGWHGGTYNELTADGAMYIKK